MEQGRQNKKKKKIKIKVKKGRKKKKPALLLRQGLWLVP